MLPSQTVPMSVGSTAGAHLLDRSVRPVVQASGVLTTTPLGWLKSGMQVGRLDARLQT